MKIKTLATVCLAMIAANKRSLELTTTSAIHHQVIALPPTSPHTYSHFSIAREAVSKNSTADYLLVRDLLEDFIRRQKAARECIFHFSPDTLLTILFGAGSLLEPIFITLFLHQVLVVNVR
jgi:hypothetical protein